MKTSNLVILLAFLSFSLTNAQNYVDDAGFENFSCPDICASQAGVTFNGGICSNNWQRSHGSPTISNSTGNGANSSNRYAFTWYANTGNPTGEGIYANLNQTMYSGDTYNITIWGQNQTASSNDNEAIIKASSLLAPAIGCSYGEIIPTTNAETIQTVTLNGSVNNWYLLLNSYSYSPNSDYDQLWLYPYTTSSTQLDVLWDEVSVCASIRRLHTTTRLNEIESVSAIDYIEVGGTSPVTLNSNTNSELTAGNYILFTPRTRITATNSSNLRAYIETSSCGSIAYRPPPTENEEGSTNRKTSSDQNQNDNITIYPNPSTSGKFNITVNTKNEEPILLQVVDVFGKQILQKTMISNRDTVDLSRYPNGVYYIKLAYGSIIETKKIIYK